MKLSIITVNFNNVIGLQKTMQSVFEQTFTDYEYIIIDGGSNDGSRELIEKHADKITYWLSEKDKGIYNAMNKGIVKATGNYLLFLNSGDTFFDSYVCEKMVGKEHLTADIIYGRPVMVFPDREQIRDIPSKLSVEYLIKDAPNHNSCYISKRLFDEYGLYDENLMVVADWAFFFKVIVTGNATCLYKDLNVVNFPKDGLSNQPEGRELMKIERAKVISEQLPPAVRDLLEKSNSLLLRNQELEGIMIRKKLLMKRLFNLIIAGFERRIKLIQKLF